MIEIIKDISSILSCVLVIISFLGLIIKPTRQKLENWIRKVTSSQETTENLNEFSVETAEKFDELSIKLDQQQQKLDDQKKTSAEADKQILSHMKEIDTRLDKLDQRVLENERDRIKAELSEYASRCARGMKIYPEEMVHIEEMYHKYKDQMHCNSTGSQNYQTIVDYYEKQAWLKF